MTNYGTKIHESLLDFGSKFKAKYGKSIEALPGKFNSLMINTGQTVQDLPAIALQELKTAGPKTLDLANDYIYKPVKRFNQGLYTGQADTGDNALDRIADEARADDTKFYDEHEFKQKENRQYGEGLGDQLVGAATLGIGSKTKIAKGIVSPFEKAFTSFLGKNKKLKKSIDTLKLLRKQHADALKKGTKFTDEQIAAYNKAIQSSSDDIANMTKTASEKFAKTPAGKLPKELDAVMNPKTSVLKSTGNIIKNNPKKAGLAGAGALGLAYGLSGDEEEVPVEEITDGADVPIPGGADTGEVDNQTLDTASKKNKGGDDVVERDDGSTIGSDKELTDSVNNKGGGGGGGGGNRIPAGSKYDKNTKQSYPMHYQGGSLYITGPDGKVYTLATGINESNKTSIYQNVGTEPLPF